MITIILLFLKTTSDNKIRQARDQLTHNNFNAALKSYEQAVNLWPFNKNSIILDQIRVQSQNVYKNAPLVTIFFKEDANTAQVTELQYEINRLSGVESTKYISQHEAYEKYKKQNKDKPELNELVTENILPSFIEVTAINKSDKKLQEEITSLAKSKSYVADVAIPSLYLMPDISQPEVKKIPTSPLTEDDKAQARLLIDAYFKKLMDNSADMKSRISDYKILSLDGVKSANGMEIQIEYAIKPVAKENMNAMIYGLTNDGWTNSIPGCDFVIKEANTYEPIKGLATGCFVLK